jgi:hypothetical protein
VRADWARMTLEWKEDMEGSKAHRDAQTERAKRQKKEASTRRQRKCRGRKMVDQIQSGKRDANGKIIHTKVISTPCLLNGC